MLYAQIIVKQRAQVQELTYSLNAQIIPYIKVGSLVIVPLRRKLVEGVVVGFSRSIKKELKGNIREIIKLVKGDNIFSTAQIGVIHKLAEYYGAPLAEVAFHALRLPSFWPSNTDQHAHKPLVISGSWSQRRRAYQQIINRTTGRVLFVFAQQTYADDFQGLAEESEPDYHIYMIKDFEGKKKTHELVEMLTVNHRAVLLGTLGDIFFPLQTNDIIVIDQPNHIGAKYQSRPFMNARRVALTRGEIEGLQIVLGDSVVSPEDILLVKDKQFRLKFAPKTLYPLTIIDRRGQNEILAPSLLDEIGAAIKLNQKILVLVMARGWSTAIICQGCGQILSCQNCQRTIGVGSGTENLPTSNLVCSFCSADIKWPQNCPHCRSSMLKLIGEGVSAVRSYLADRFPRIGVIELSSDQPTSDRSSQITVATEKIFSFPDTEFDRAFIVSADRLLAGTHLDGSWHLLGYLIELTSFARRITVQTLFPESNVWGAVASGNIRSYFTAELSSRQKLHLPPYGTIITVRGSANTIEKLEHTVEKISLDIQKLLPSVDISPPKIDDRSGGNFHGGFSIFYPKPLPNSLKLKLALLLPPAWHLDFD